MWRELKVTKQNMEKLDFSQDVGRGEEHRARSADDVGSDEETEDATSSASDPDETVDATEGKPHSRRVCCSRSVGAVNFIRRWGSCVSQGNLRGSSQK